MSFSTEYSATKDGSVLIERKFAGVTTDRFIAKKEQPPLLRHARLWMIGALATLMAKSANVQIEMPLVPILELPLTEALQLQLLELRESIKQREQEIERLRLTNKPVKVIIVE